MKRAILVLFVFAIGGAAVVGGLGYYVGWFDKWIPGRATTSGQPEGPTAQGMRVEVVKPIRRVVVQPGQVEPLERVEVIPKITGYLKSYDKDMDQKPIDTGGRIKPGQVLATLFVPELEAELRVKEASLRQAQDAVRAAAEQERVAMTDRDKYQAEYDFREAELRRHEKLFKEGGIQADLLDEKIKQDKAAKAAVTNAVARIDLARAESRVAEARVAVAQGEVKRVADMFAYATLTAPTADGGALYVVTRRWVDPGAYVQPGGGTVRDALLSLMRVDRVKVTTDQFPELDSPYIGVGDKSAFEASSLPGRTFEGTVSRISPSLQLPARTMRVEIDLANPDGQPLYSGMYGSVRLTLGEKKGVWLVPPPCVHKEDGKAFVFAVVKDKLEKTPVTIGVTDGRHVEILSGVTGDSQVVRQTYGGTPKGGEAVTVMASKK
jgi:RND family efflux transporter MFP subunit